MYGAIKQSNGDLTINTAIGKGTAVSLFIPAQDEKESLELAGETPGSEKALIVDDQPDVLDVAIELFRTMGYEVLSANNGKDALGVLERTPDVGVLFSDVVMPGMSGIDLGKKARDLIPGIRVILASGYAEPAMKASNDSLGDFKFLKKPYRMAEIIKMLRLPG